MGDISTFKLTSKQHDELVAARLAAKKTRDYELARRIRAIILLGTRKKNREQVAEICECGLRTVYSWQNRYQDQGLEGLRPRYKPKQCALSKQQQTNLSELLRAGPESSGFDTGTWTCAMVVELIKKRFEVAYTVSGLTKLLHRLGFSFQVPQIQLAKADPKKQKEWAEKTYPAILRKARKLGGRVFFSATNVSSSSPAPAQEHGLCAAKGPL
jgi:transposase